MADRGLSKHSWYKDLRAMANGEHPGAAEAVIEAGPVDTKPVRRRRRFDDQPMTKAEKKWLGLDNDASKKLTPVAEARANGRSSPTARHKMQAIAHIVNLHTAGIIRADVAVSVINEIAR
jgi:hypothetical protein